MVSEKNIQIKKQELIDLAMNALCSAGIDKTEASVVAEILVWADAVKRPNQGVWRIPILCTRIGKGLYSSPCHITYQHASDTILKVDGGNGLGHYVANHVMENTIQKAKEHGICASFVQNSNFLGATGYYAMKAAENDMVGIVMSNSFPKVRAMEGTKSILGTNPLAFSCPTPGNTPIIVDMATSEKAGSTVRRQIEAQSLNDKSDTSILEPMAGHKGFALGLMVEILSGVLSGAGFSHQVKSMYENMQEPGNNGHFFLAIDIATLMPLSQFYERIEQLLIFVKASGEENIIKYPGENRQVPEDDVLTISLDVLTEIKSLCY